MNAAQVQGSPTSAPGARAAFHCGLWALLSSILCFPVSIALAIVALVQNSKAKRFASEQPGSFARPSSAGMVMAICALVLPVLIVPVGIISAISIPALLGQRERARAKAVQIMVTNAAGEVARVSDTLHEQENRRPEPERVIRTVLAMPGYQFPSARNPYGGTESPFIEGSSPHKDGEVALEGLPNFTDPVNGQTYPAIFLRGQYKIGDKREIHEKIVALD